MEHRRLLSPAWYLVPLAVFAIGWNVGVAWAGHAWELVGNTDITSSNQALQAEGKSIAVFTDVVQANRKIECFMNDVVRDAPAERMGQAPIPLPKEDDGTTWTLVAWERHGRNNVAVTCSPADKQVDNSQYAAVTVEGYNARLWVGNAITFSSVIATFAIFIVIFRIRRRQLGLNT